jgi:SHS2 domain-containing protein
MGKTSVPPYEFIEHTADMGVRVRGKDEKDLFSKAALVLMDLLISSDPWEAPTPVGLSLSGTDSIDLLVRWLGELHYLLEGESLVTTGVRIETLTHVRLDAVAWTVPFRPDRHERRYGIKAVTYHQAAISEKGGGLEAVILFDV